VGLVYSQKATEVLAPWFQNVYNYFIADPDYDLNVFFVPMLGGVKEAAAGSLEKELKKGTPPELYKHVLIYKGDVGSYKSALKMDQKDIPYIFVLDKDGKIVYQTSGAYSDEKIEKMDELVAGRRISSTIPPIRSLRKLQKLRRLFCFGAGAPRRSRQHRGGARAGKTRG
jgi:hypothetical protein